MINMILDNNNYENTWLWISSGFSQANAGIFFVRLGILKIKKIRLRVEKWDLNNDNAGAIQLACLGDIKIKQG